MLEVSTNQLTTAIQQKWLHWTTGTLLLIFRQSQPQALQFRALQYRALQTSGALAGQHAWLLHKVTLQAPTWSLLLLARYHIRSCRRCTGTHIQIQVPRAFIQVEGIIEEGVRRQTTRVDSNSVGWRSCPVCKERDVLLRRTCPQA